MSDDMNELRDKVARFVSARVALEELVQRQALTVATLRAQRDELVEALKESVDAHEQAATLVHREACADALDDCEDCEGDMELIDRHRALLARIAKEGT